MIHTLLYNERIKILVACEKEMVYSWYECLRGGKIIQVLELSRQRRIKNLYEIGSYPLL